MNGPRHWGFFIAFLAVALVFIIGISLLIYHFAPRPYPAYWFPFFPFGFFGAFLLIFLAFGILRWTLWGWGWRGRGYYRGYRYDSAHQILRERYARGEITKEQMEAMERDLDGSRSS